MYKRITFISAPLVAGLLMAGTVTRADDNKDARPSRGQCSANEVIGKKVKNLQDEDLGKVQDLIVNFQSGSVPFAIIAHGGVLGAGRTKTAVPLDSLRASDDGKSFILAATREQLRVSTKSPNGGWAEAANSEWAQNVDGFYGTPSMNRSRFDPSSPGDRTYVRDPVPKGAEMLMSPADTALCEKVCDSVELVSIRVENGVTHIYGQVESEDTRKAIESKVRSVQGVNKVESHLRVKSP
jgi:sporulation protein YlmC with PRC-barrel domain